MQVKVAKIQQRKRRDAFNPPQIVSCRSGHLGMTATSLVAVVRRCAIVRFTSVQRTGARRVLEMMGSHYPRNRLTLATKIRATHAWIVNSLNGASGRSVTLLAELASKKRLGKSLRNLQQMGWDVLARPRRPAAVLAISHAM